MEFVKHRHPLVLNEYYLGGEGDACYFCRGPLRFPLAHCVYLCTQGSKSSVNPDDDDDDDDDEEDDDDDCDKMFVHKSCAELPLILTDSYMHPQHPITLKTDFMITCSICHDDTRFNKVNYFCSSCKHNMRVDTTILIDVVLTVCLKCVTSPLVYHPSHNQHALALLQRPAAFRCDACGREASDSSSCKCTLCPFWIHMSCALLSSSFQSQSHGHPLLLAYSLPQQFLNFEHKCKICKDYIMPTLWLYYCTGCRIFVHIQCANATLETTKRPLGEFSDLVHLPARDESSLNLLRQLLIHQMMINQGEDDALTWSFSPIVTVTAVDVAGPKKEVIHHWCHGQHPLILRNKCSTKTGKDSNEDSEDVRIIVCDGCTYPINSSETSYYECHPCKYFLHSYLFKCDGCNNLKSGIHIASDDGHYKLDIGCAMLPKKIKHEAHDHPLTQAFLGDHYGTKSCEACRLSFFRQKELIFKCSGCFFYLHARCALKPHKL